ncbi:MAG: class I adenylate cyclase [Methylomicrobium sp.]|nr:class I adenylate cyclase [Methylomicrobium sp.]
MVEKKHLTPIRLGSPGEDISKKDLLATLQRFKNLHLLQQKRIQSFLQPRQRVFLELLPLLFHQNVPLLPGFISSETPAGILDYSPSRQVLLHAAQFSRSYQYKTRALANYPILGLFLMGSVGSIAFTKTSDMDIWLCHDPALLPSALEELQQKATAIEEWAMSLDLEVHFFLIDHEKFKSGQDIPISDESSGKTQHYLLLEEFYRTAVYIAGRSPAWWLVPPQEEHRHSGYIKHLLDNKFISELEVIDFGSLENAPPEEFITVTLWHIYKAIGSPHKSLLKLMLMECYASEYPNTQWLCSEMKKAVHGGEFSLEDLDPYLLIYQKLENYLSSPANRARLELIRHSLYIKIMGFANTEQDPQKQLYRTEFIKHIAHRWQWPETLLPEISRQQSWNILKATREHDIILRHLAGCYRMILNFAGQHVQRNLKDNEDLKLIGRKLHSFLDKKPGKIEFITTRSALQTKEQQLSLVETSFADNQSGWSLYLGHVTADNLAEQSPIKNTWSLIELLAWIIVNGLYHKKLKLNLDSKTLTLSTNELQTTTEQLHDFISSRLYKLHLDLPSYKQPNQCQSSLLFINIGTEPEGGSNDGRLVMSERSDPFSYGKSRQSFVQSVNRVSISNWGEVTVSRALGLDGLFDTFTDIFNNHRLPIADSDVKVICNTSARANSISQRAQSVFQTLISWFGRQNSNESPRYILAGAKDYYIFQRKNKALHYRSIGTRQELLNELSQAQGVFSPTHIDPFCLKESEIPELLKLNKANTIQVFHTATKTGIQLYLLDEKGALFRQHYPSAKIDGLLRRYQQFLDNILNRYFFDESILIEHYEIRHTPSAIIKYIPSVPNRINLTRELDIRVSGEHSASYTLYCNEKEFSTLTYGKRALAAAAEYILEFRQSNQRYPIHISDIDVPLANLGLENASELQTIHLLKYKQKIENRLNSISGT